MGISNDKQWEDYLFQQLIDAKFPEPVREYRFLKEKKRRFRFDFAWPEHKIATEMQGGVFNRGGHVRPIGYTNDREKMNLAVIDGWAVFEVTSAQVNNGQALGWLTEYFTKRGII